MTNLYNCRHSGNQFRISKFDHHFDLESSYLCTETECTCPAGHRPTCRHRQMLPKFIARGTVNTEWFFDFDRGGWVQGEIEPAPEVVIEETAISIVSYIELPANTDVAEEFSNLLTSSRSDATPASASAKLPTIRRRV